MIDLETIERLAKAARDLEKAYPTPGKHATLEGLEIQRALDSLHYHLNPARALELVEELKRTRELLEEACSFIEEYLPDSAHAEIKVAKLRSVSPQGERP